MRRSAFLGLLVLGFAAPASLSADCYTRCKPSYFFPERIDCRTTCDGGSSSGNYSLSDYSGPFYGGIRFALSMPQGKSGVLKTQSPTFYGVPSGQLAGKSESLAGMGLAIEFTPTKDGFGPVIDLGGWSQPIQVDGKSAGTFANIYVGLGLEAGFLMPKIRTRAYLRGTYVLLQSSYYENKAPEGYADMQESYWAPIVGGGLEFRMKGNYFLSVGVRYLMAETSYAGARRVSLDHNSPVLIAGISYVP